MRFENKNAVVTGGAMGIGRAISLAFAREGARVAVVDLDAVQADDTVGMIGEAGGEAFSIAADIGSAEQVGYMAAKKTRTGSGRSTSSRITRVAGL